MEYPESYELIFQASGAEDDVVTVRLTARSGAADTRSTRTSRASSARRSVTAARYACWRAVGTRSSEYRSWPGP